MTWKFGDLLVNHDGEPPTDLLVMFICWREEGDTVFWGHGIVDEDDETQWVGQLLVLGAEDWYLAAGIK
jgi:hypothetical protein